MKYKISLSTITWSLNHVANNNVHFLTKCILVFLELLIDDIP